MSIFRRYWLLGLCALLSTAQRQTGPDIVPPPPASLQACDRASESSTLSEPYLCYYDWASTTKRWDEAARHLRERLEKVPGDPKLLAALALNRASKGDLDEMVKNYRLALDGFEAQGDAEGVIAAHLGIANYFQWTGRLMEAEEHLKLAESAAAEYGHELERVDVEVAQGWLAFRRRDLSRASTKLRIARRRFQAAVAGVGTRTRRQVRLEATIANAFGAIYWALVKPREAAEAYRTESALWLRLGDSYNATTPLFNLALVAANNQRTLGLSAADVRKEVEVALKAALRVGHKKDEMGCRQLLGNLLAREIQDSGGRDFSPAIEQIEMVLRLGRELRDEAAENSAVRTLASLYLDHYGDFKRSSRLFDAALASASARQNLEQIAWNHLYRFQSLRRGGKPDEAFPYALRALDAIERIRDRQTDSETRARLFSAWANQYRGVYLSLANPQGDPDRGTLDLAVSVIERMRARELLSELDRSSATSRLIPEGELATRRSELLQGISHLQAKLLAEKASEAERRELVEEVESLEVDLRRVEQALGRKSRKYQLVRAPRFATLDQVQDALDAGEVILSYQLGNRFGDLLRIAPKSVKVFSVPGRSQLADALEFLSGLIQRRDRTESSGAGLLHEQLLEEALRDLPSTVKRLIVVPDAGLEELPFAVLRSTEASLSLAQRYDVVMTPSLTAWLRWKRAIREPAQRELLALADPELPISAPGEGAVAEERAWSLSGRFSPKRLPRAREEGRSAIRTLSGNGRLAIGRNASEDFIKRVDLDGYSVIHFAVHAVIDKTNPERTALLLAPGSETEDGLLQVREIVNLDLSGQLVVLSACETASGEILAGEGVLSLARAFFVAGAHAVVGSLWPLRDDDAAAFFERFYRHLGDGENATEALSAAQRERIAEGAPAAAWAGLVLLGNGDLTPFPGGVRRYDSWWPSALALAIGLIGLGWALRRALTGTAWQ